MDWRKIGRRFLFPCIAVAVVLLPSSALWLTYAMLTLNETAPLRIASYVLAFYTLTIWCARMPGMIRCFQSVKGENPYVQRWVSDPRLRTNVTLTGNVLWNGAYAAMQLGLGIYHRSPWYYSLSAYYMSLAVMRLFLVRHTLRHKPGEEMELEFKRYRICGWIFLFMNLALSGMTLYMIREGRVMRHHEITTIAMAAYTFTALTVAIINVVKYRRYNSPALSASKIISLAAACVSVLTLENTMLTTFRGENMTRQTRSLFLGLSGGAIFIVIIVMAVCMIAGGNQIMESREK